MKISKNTQIFDYFFFFVSGLGIKYKKNHPVLKFIVTLLLYLSKRRVNLLKTASATKPRFSGNEKTLNPLNLVFLPDRFKV